LVDCENTYTQGPLDHDTKTKHTKHDDKYATDDTNAYLRNDDETLNSRSRRDDDQEARVTAHKPQLVQESTQDATFRQHGRRRHPRRPRPPAAVRLLGRPHPRQG
jgi:hypothetical protein